MFLSIGTNLYSIISPAFIFLFFMQQVSNMATNLTSNERLNQKRYFYLVGPTGKFQNPFDRGVIKNCLEHFHVIEERKLHRFEKEDI